MNDAPRKPDLAADHSGDDRVFPALKPLWKVTFRMGSLYAVLFSQRWHEEVRVYRWKWRANLAAFCWMMPVMPSILKQAAVEQYWPSSNIVPLRKIA